MGSFVAVYDPEHKLTLDRVLPPLCGRSVGRFYGVVIRRGRLEALANALLVGLGKKALGRDLQRSAAIKWRYTLAWLAGEQTATVFLADIDELTREARHRLPDLEHEGRDIFLIYSNRRSERWLQPISPDFVGAEDFLAQWRDTPPVAVDPPRAPYPRVPRVEFARFRNVCHHELSAEEFKIVNATWRRVHGDILKFTDSASQPLDEESVAELLHQVVCKCEDYQESIAAIRAAQAALLTRGYLVKLLMPRFARAAQLASPADLERGIAERLRWYSGSARPAAGLIRLLTPSSSLEEIADLNADNVADDGSSFELAGATTQVPEIAQGILRTQHTARNLLQATSPRFLTYPRGRELLDPTPQGISRWLRDLTVEAGISLVGATTRRARLDVGGWVSRRGISVQQLWSPDAD